VSKGRIKLEHGAKSGIGHKDFLRYMAYAKSLTNLRLPKDIILHVSRWFWTSETKVCLGLTNYLALAHTLICQEPTFFLSL